MGVHAGLCCAETQLNYALCQHLTQNVDLHQSVVKQLGERCCWHSIDCRKSIRFV